MTFEELLQHAGATGALPKVSIDVKLSYASSKKGVVTNIKDETSIKNHTYAYKGCAVRFEGMAYDVWFYAEEGTDKRKHYMSQLTLLKDKKS